MALTDNIQAAYKLDESSGNATDSSGNGFTLTNTNTVGYAAALINNGADFGTTNTNKQLKSTTDLGLTATSAFTISTWVKLRTEISSGAYMFGGIRTSGSPWIGRSLQYQYNSGTRRVVATAHSQTVAQVISNLTMGTSNWYNFIFTYSGGTTGTMELFINNVSAGTQSCDITNNFTSSDFTSLGAYEDGSYSPIYQDETYIWSRVLSSTERGQIYNSGAGFQYPFTTTSIKSINGLAYASVKSYNGLAIGSVKSVNGLT